MAVEGVIANGVTQILMKLSSVVVNEITLVWDLNDELKNLQSTLNMIMAVMEDAEKKQLSKAAVRLWMENLKSIAYDAEDILDDYSYEIIRKRTQTGEVSKPSLFFRWRMAQKIKKVNEKFNKIAKRKHDLGLQTKNVGSSSSHELMMKNRETISSVAKDWKIVGRENDESNIIKMLLEEENPSNNICNTNQGDDGKHVSVIPIVGMGGLGKTTMAQLVFNAEAIKKHFDIKVWICVSDPFDVKKLFKNIAKSLDEKAICDEVTTMENIVCGVQNHLTGKKFLLVLDDVWNESSVDWYKLKTPLMVGAEGSKILVTTRNEKVALIMVDKFEPYSLGILKENDCWSLFKEIAFGSAAGAKETPNLAEIGKQMVTRCKCLPLAVIFLGSLMRSKKKEDEWKTIRDAKLWHKSQERKNSEILPSLRLSYDNLPSHLKVCFSYCCLFPKDWIIRKQTLIRLWMAEGFLIEAPEENTMSMEEIGNDYFHSLLSSFFFQDVVKDEDGDIATCKMHDLVHDLARSVVGKNECLIIEKANDIDHISEETRRLNLLVDFDEDMVPNVLKAMKKAKKLRTVFVNQQTIRFDIVNAFKKNKRLRVLDLSGSHVTSESTSSIGVLKHLRYLVAYEILFLEGIGRLSFLQTLLHFNVGDKKDDKNTSVIEELEGLNLLSVLSIGNLQNVSSGTDACRANLKEKKNLYGLRLTWKRDYDYNTKRIYNHEVVIEGLRPHPNLRILGINDFMGAKVPSWIQDSSCLPNLEKLILDGCIYIEQLAGFGALPFLRYLRLQSLKKVVCLGNEFYYSVAAGGSSATGGGGGESSSSSTASTSEASTTTITAFPSLKKLSLRYMDSLKEWVVPPPPPPQASTTTTTGATTTYCLPLLEEIEIYDCPLLSTITPTTTTTSIFPSLKVLYLADIDGRAAETLVTNNLKSLTSLTLYNIPNLISLPSQGLMENNNTLLCLSIEGCHQFEGFFPSKNGGMSSSSSSLQSLKLYACPALRLFPKIRSLTSLRSLEIQECKESMSLLNQQSRSFFALFFANNAKNPSLFSSLEHMEHVKILKNKSTRVKEEVIFEWRKPNSYKE